MSEEEKEYYENIIKILQEIREDLKECLKGDEKDEII